MSKAFTTEKDGDETEDEPPELPALPPGVANYLLPSGFAALKAELHQLQDIERPKTVEVVTWAAGNGDRSENGDYLYGKKRLREIDRRVRYLIKRLEGATVVDPQDQQKLAQVFFGATVTYVGQDDIEHVVTLVGLDETDPARGRISWISPIARALMKARVGDTVEFRLPEGRQAAEILAITYNG